MTRSWVLATKLFARWFRCDGMIIQRSLVAFAAFFFTCSALANPVVDNVAAGQVTIEQVPNSTVINQASQKAIINWQSFNIGQQEATHFNQPAGGIALNRISPNQGASQIYGHLTATGQIILVNPAGIYFGPSAFVNVGGLIATTANITDANFLSGNYQFNKVDPYSGAVINEGTIIAAQHGLVALVAPSVVNNGMIQANMGKVVLASGNAFTMSFDGNGLVNFVIDEATTARGHDQNGVELSDGVKNTGSMIADGGAVMVTGKAAASILDHVINMEGVVQAHSVLEQSGEIILSADTDEANDNVIRLAGALDASGKTTGLIGGNVTVTSKYILADNGANIDVSGDAGGGIVRIGGNYKGGGPLPNATATLMAPTAVINADAITSGNGGEVILWANDYTVAYGSISARGGAVSGDGGFIETSGKNYLDVNGITISTLAPHGETGLWLLDPTDITISTGSTSNITFDTSLTPDGYRPTTNSTSTSTLNVTTLTTALASSDIMVTTESGSTGGGNITVNTPINWNSDNDLTLRISGSPTLYSIFLNDDIVNLGSGSFIITENPASGLIPVVLQASENRLLQAGGVSIGGSGIVGSGTQTLTITINTNPSTSSSSFNINTNPATSTLNVVLNGPASNPAYSWLTDFSPSTNTSDGTLTVNSGVLDMTSSGVDALPTGALTIASGAYIMMYDNQNLTFTNSVSLGGTIVVLGANSGTVNNLQGAITLTGTNAGVSLGYNPVTSSGTQMSSFTIANTFSGSGSLTISANASQLNDVTVTGTSTYTGSTTINLDKTSADVIPLYFSDITATNSNFGNGTVINLLQGALIYTGPTATVARTLSFESGIFSPREISLLTETNPLTWSGQITGGDADNTYFFTNLVDNSTPIFGGNTITISNTGNNFAAYELVGGSLNLGASGVIPDAVTITRDITFNNFSETVGNIEDDYGLSLALGSATLTFGGNNLSTSLNNFITISGTNGNIVKQGSGTTTFTGGTTSYTGTTNINAGTLLLSSSGTLGSGTITVNSGGTLETALTTLSRAITLNSGTLLSSSGTRTMSGAISLTGNNSTISATAGQFNITGGINGANTLLTSGAGTIQFGTTAIGGTTPPTALTTSASGATIIATTITTNGTQDYNNATSVSGTRIINANGASSDANFDGALSLGTSGNLTINSGRNIIFNAAVSQTSGGTLSLNAVDAASSITTGASGSFNISNFTITNGRWSQLGTLPSFTISSNFDIGSADGFLRATGGDGTLGNPYQIADIYGLQGVATANLLNQNFILTADLNAASTSNWRGGTGFYAIGKSAAYSGTFDGDGYIVDNLFINESTSIHGLFGTLTGTIANLGVTNADVTASSSVGILVGVNQGTISGAYTTGTVDATSSGTANLGGLVGLNDSTGTGTISNSYSWATVNATSGTATALGGLVGQNANTDAAAIDKTYAAGNVTGGSARGGLIGTNAGTPGTTVTNSFYDSQVCVSCNSTAGGTAQATAQMQTQSTFTSAGWDFSAPAPIIWRFTGPNTYPILNVFDPVPDQIISGAITITDGTLIRLLASGTSIGTTTVTSNAFSFALAFGTIADNADLLLFLDTNGGTLANTYAIAPTSSGNLTGLVMTANNLRIDATASAANNGSLIAAKGAYSDTDILFSGSGNNLTLGGASGQTVTLLTTSSTAYTANGTIDTLGGVTSHVNFGGTAAINSAGITTAGNQTYAAAVTLGATTALSAGSGAINFSTSSSTINNAQALTLGTTGAITFTGVIGGSTPLSSLTINSGSSSVAMNASGISTSGNQTYNNNAITLGTGVTLTSSSGNITGSGNIAGGGNAFAVSLGGSSGSLSGALSNMSSFTKSGTGALTLSGDSSAAFNGGVTLSAGTLTVGHNSALGTGTLSLNGGTLTSNNNSRSISNAYTLDATSTIGGTLNLTLTGTGTLNTGRTLNITNTNTTSLNGSLSGAGNITVADAGFLSIGSSANNSSYSGTTTLSTNALITIGSTNTPLGTGNLVLNGGNLQVTTGSAVALNNNYTVNGSMGILSSGSLTLAGAGTLSAGTVSFTGLDIVLSGNVSGTGNITIGVNSGSLFTVSSPDNSSYSGTTTLNNNGVLRIATATNALGTGSLVLNSGFLRAHSTNVVLNNPYTIASSISIGSITGNSLTLSNSGTFSSGTTTVGGSATLSGNISGAGNIQMINAGDNSLIISGADNSSYSGTVTLNTASGTSTLEIGVATNALGSGTLVLDANATLQASVDTTLTNSYTLGNSPSINGSHAIILSGSGTLNSTTVPLTVNNSANTTFSGVLSGAGNGLSKYGSGTLILSGNNTYDGATTISEGVLSVSALANGGSASNIGASTNAAANLVLDGGTLQYTGGTVSTNRNFTLSDGTTSSIEVTTGATNLTISGAAASTTGALTKIGGGTLILSGANAYTGATTINAGTLSVGTLANGGSASNIGASSSAAANLVLGSGTLQYTGGTAAINRAFTLTNSTSNTFDVTQSGTALTFSGQSASTSGSLVKIGSGTLTLTGANQYTGTTTINAGILSANTLADGGTNSSIGASSNAAANLVLGGGTLQYTGGTVSTNRSFTLTAGTTNSFEVTTGATNLTISGSDTNTTGALTKAGGGTLTLSGTNLHTGGTTISAGTLSIGANANLGATPGAATPGNITIAGGTLQTTAGFTLSSNRGLALGAGGGTIQSDSGTLTYSGIITGSTVLTKAGAGELVLGGSSSAFSGGVTLSAGTLTIGHNSALGSGTLTLNGGTLQANATRTIANAFIVGGSAVIGGASNLNLVGSGTLNSGLTVSSSATTSFLGDIDGANGITQSSGIVSLSGNNTYIGAVVINGGTLNADSNDALGATAGNTTINSGATLAINSAAVGAEAITLNSGALNSTGTSSLAGAVTLTSSSTNTLSAAGTFTLNGNINGAGALSLGGAGSYNINSNVGNTTPITSLITSTGTTLSGNINTVNNQTFGGSVTLGASKTFSSSAGAIAFNNTLNGAFDLALSSNGTTTFGGIVGGGAPLNSLTVDASGINISGGAITTVGNQTYNAVVTPSATTTFASNTAGSATITFNSGVSGSNNIAVSGNAAGTNTLLMNSGGTQNWSVTANNGGSIDGMSGYSGAFSFANMRNLTGGSGADTFTLNGGTLAGTIVGGAGTNTLVGDNVTNTFTITAANAGSATGVTSGFSAIHNITGGSGNDSFTLNGGTLAGSINGGSGTNTLTADNVTNTWNLSGSNAASSITGVSGGFSNVHNIVGGSGNDNFIFADGASVTGTISGGATLTNDGNNILDFTAYATLINAFMTSDSDTFIGNVKNSVNSIIANYSNIDKLIGKTSLDNTITIPSSKTLAIVTFDSGTTRSGSIGDPLYFQNFRLIGTAAPVTSSASEPETTVPSDTTTTVDVAQVVQQPTTSSSTNANAPASATPAWVDTTTTLSQNMTEITSQASQEFDSDLEKIKINPYCMATN